MNQCRSLDFVALPPSKNEHENAEQEIYSPRIWTICSAQPWRKLALTGSKIQKFQYHRATREKNITMVKGVHLFLDPQAIGYLRVAHLKIPGVPAWDNLSAETSYAQRNFFIKHLVLAPELVLEEVNFDASPAREARRAACG